jgi:hypothetical protein
MTKMRWACRRPAPPAGNFALANIRNTASPPRRAWLKPEQRVIPLLSPAPAPLHLATVAPVKIEEWGVADA